jgi:hydrogenase maturation protein HypF
MATSARRSTRIRLGIRVRGVVQGVGFRPWVHRVATERGLDGLVRNDSDGVWIEVEGDEAAVRQVPLELGRGGPRLASISGIEVVDLPLGDADGFRVVESGRAASGTAAIPADAATCDACLRELFDPADRRFRYPFINCTDCGPRYTIVRETPYDRSQTTMSAFSLCGRCRAEYENPLDRRFHAEPNACPACGPRLELVRQGWPPLFGEAALQETVAALRNGDVVAIKGIGGFHLAADAGSDVAVALLRARKGRPAKPFAIMARDLDSAETVVEVSDAARRALCAASRPIVLLPRVPGAPISGAVAPQLSEIGVFLPYSPLHHLLLEDGPPLLVMTSGNLTEEPIARQNDEALAKLARVADAILLHDRDIHTRADDSVVRIVRGEPQPVRRSRGFVPDPVRLPFESTSVLAVGGDLKNTVCLTRGDEAFLSPHVGDLENPEAVLFFEEVVEKLGRLLAVQPAAVAHDLHPDYRSTRWALASGLAREPVQHHHAHLAACLAENGRTAPAIGIAFDGTGCGPSGDLWGGEVLVADLAAFRRAGHLRRVQLAGAEAAIRQPWRTAAAALLDAGETLEPLEGLGVDIGRLAKVRSLLESDFRSPAATGAGRWFDAVAALCGFTGLATYEGQAAVELEAMAGGVGGDPYPFELGRTESGAAPFEIDMRPMVRGIVRDARQGAGAAVVSARFHETLARIVFESARHVRRETGIDVVAMSGGCFQNRILTERSAELLASDGFDVLVHRRVPPNDGGLSLGQAAVAGWRRRNEKEH